MGGTSFYFIFPSFDSALSCHSLLHLPPRYPSIHPSSSSFSLFTFLLDYSSSLLQLFPSALLFFYHLHVLPFFPNCAICSCPLRSDILISPSAHHAHLRYFDVPPVSTFNHTILNLTICCKSQPGGHPWLFFPCSLSSTLHPSTHRTPSHPFSYLLSPFCLVHILHYSASSRPSDINPASTSSDPISHPVLLACHYSLLRLLPAWVGVLFLLAAFPLHTRRRRSNPSRWWLAFSRSLFSCSLIILSSVVMLPT